MRIPRKLKKKKPFKIINSIKGSELKYFRKLLSKHNGIIKSDGCIIINSGGGFI